jgi:hypothetical protein
MNPRLQEILHNITTRLAALEEAQKKEWQGLPDEEKDKLVLKNVGQDCTVDPYDFIHAIEAKLKEKNG